MGIESSLFGFLEKVSANAFSIGIDIHEIYGYINTEPINKRHIFNQLLILRPAEQTILCAFNSNKDPESKLIIHDYLFVLLSRNGTTEQKIPIETQIDLSSVSDEKSIEMRLCGIIAYCPSPRHYCVFKCYDDKWYVINDKNCYSIGIEDVLLLSGGSMEDCESLYRKMNGEKWVSSVLLYKKNTALIV